MVIVCLSRDKMVSWIPRCVPSAVPPLSTCDFLDYLGVLFSININTQAYLGVGDRIGPDASVEGMQVT